MPAGSVPTWPRALRAPRTAAAQPCLPACPPAARAPAGGNDKLYATFLPVEDPAQAPPGTTPRGISILARDLQVRRHVVAGEQRSTCCAC